MVEDHGAGNGEWKNWRRAFVTRVRWASRPCGLSAEGTFDEWVRMMWVRMYCVEVWSDVVFLEELDAPSFQSWKIRGIGNSAIRMRLCLVEVGIWAVSCWVPDLLRICEGSRRLAPKIQGLPWSGTGYLAFSSHPPVEKLAAPMDNH